MQETWVRFLGRGDPWRREWLPPPVFLPGESHGERSRVCYMLKDIVSWPCVYRYSRSQVKLNIWTLFWIILPLNIQLDIQLSSEYSPQYFCLIVLQASQSKHIKMELFHSPLSLPFFSGFPHLSRWFPHLSHHTGQKPSFLPFPHLLHLIYQWILYLGHQIDFKPFFSPHTYCSHRLPSCCHVSPELHQPPSWSANTWESAQQTE